MWWRVVTESIENVLILSEADQYQQKVIGAKNQSTISTRWVLTDKFLPGGSSKVKARLVARGFEERLIEKRIDSPTSSREALRFCFATA